MRCVKGLPMMICRQVPGTITLNRHISWGPLSCTQPLCYATWSACGQPQHQAVVQGTPAGNFHLTWLLQCPVNSTGMPSLPRPHKCLLRGVQGIIPGWFWGRR